MSEIDITAGSGKFTCHYVIPPFSERTRTCGAHASVPCSAHTLFMSPNTRQLRKITTSRNRTGLDHMRRFSNPTNLETRLVELTSTLHLPPTMPCRTCSYRTSYNAYSCLASDRRWRTCLHQCPTAVGLPAVTSRPGSSGPLSAETKHTLQNYTTRNYGVRQH